MVWDPHPRGARPIGDCALVTPNQAEAQRFSLSAAGGQLAGTLRQEWGVTAVSVTLGARGAMFADQHHGARHIAPPETAAAGRSDTCGAGDRFSVAAAIALSEGADELAAATAAVAAASRFVATAVWAGDCGDPHSDRPHRGLLLITASRVIEAARRILEECA
ncbi:PfkB family carbohydrate kinase [Candidatus Mycobacterium methanotrophicum]|uniref:PfkB family carbohydrate kinase n=1 Tax=Candidatus Mycobacterium methanotrophicum TaxID=2943498 RepID=A0ABY4QTW8_9MYCO|nr:PfkB family carbohydrate kinase [Candidatus Mycobacterium methanotrophicum]UQX13225.1 PfkB family carbohydrate kinase [Candidatus Mycobacterium methanotrophicum]